MKKTSKKSKARNSNNANTVLNEVGGAVKLRLKWKYDSMTKEYNADSTRFAGHFNIEVYEKCDYVLCFLDIRLGFKKLGTAKIVAQLINNG